MKKQSKTFMNNKSELKAIISNSIRYWERRRILYNLILLAITTIRFCILIVNTNFSEFSNFEFTELLIPFVVFLYYAIMANILYCSAYIVDVFIQLSDFRNSWLKHRWMLFFSGTALASIITAYLIL